MMLAMQGQFTVVGGFRQWRKAGRTVMKGQRGACIWFPLGDKKQDGTEDTTGAGEEKSSCRFGLATVFDVKQTEDLQEANARRDAEQQATEQAQERAHWQHATEREGITAPLALPAPEQPDWTDIAYEDSCREACGL